MRISHPYGNLFHCKLTLSLVPSLASFRDISQPVYTIAKNRKLARASINPRLSQKLTRFARDKKRRGGGEREGARNTRITSIAVHACPMKRLGACKHHNPTIRSRLIYLPIKAYWKHVFQDAAAKTGPADVMRCDAMRCGEEKKEKERKKERVVNHASGFKSDTVKSFRSDL